MTIKHMIIGISGYSGTGKDEVSGYIEKEFGAVKIGFADEAKRHMATLYDFSEEQLFGPSHFRNSGDKRYPKPLFHQLKCERVGDHFEFDESAISQLPTPQMIKVSFQVEKYEIEEGRYIKFNDDDPFFFLSPREALQRYCELMNFMYELTWVRKGIENHINLANYEFLKYDKMIGLDRHVGNRPSVVNGHKITCTSDIRHWNEINFLRSELDKSIKCFLIRIKRPSVPNPPYEHRSEVEQATIPNETFDAVIDNDSSLESLHKKVQEVVNGFLNA